MACNTSDEAMDRIMADKAYHEECRDCLNHPKTTRLEPAWFRVGLMGMPKGYISDVQEEEGGQLSVALVEQESGEPSTVTVRSKTVN
jgi:hypothetical protein